jgi:hypothetical protein
MYLGLRSAEACRSASATAGAATGALARASFLAWSVRIIFWSSGRMGTSWRSGSGLKRCGASSTPSEAGSSSSRRRRSKPDVRA